MAGQCACCQRVERAVILCPRDLVQPEDFALTTAFAAGRCPREANEEEQDTLSSSSPRSLSEMERDFINASLQRHNGE
jgi:DNA-binding NtrC family response regulator